MTDLFANLSIEKKSKSIQDMELDNVSTRSGSSLSLSSSASSTSSVSSNRSLSQNSYDEDDDQLSPAYAELLKAITNGNLGMVKQMLDYGLDVNYIYDKVQNYSFLHLACLMGHSKIIKYLLDCGANAKFVTVDGHQPIDFIHSDDSNTISYMLFKMRS